MRDGHRSVHRLLRLLLRITTEEEQLGSHRPRHRRLAINRRYQEATNADENATGKDREEEENTAVERNRETNGLRW